MKYYNWNPEKNEKLQKERGMSFELIIHQIETGHVLDIYYHPNQEQYPGQKVFVVEFEEYAFLVPFVEDEEQIFLKTITPNRSETRKYLGRGK